MARFLAAPVVLFEPSGFGNALSFMEARETLARRGRVCSYDRAGTGWSDPGPDPLSIGTLDGDERGVLESASPGAPAVVVASSIGGLTAELLARRHPERLAALVLLDAGTSDVLAAVEGRMPWRRLEAACVAVPAALTYRPRLWNTACALVRGYLPSVPGFGRRRSAADDAAGASSHGGVVVARLVGDRAWQRPLDRQQPAACRRRGGPRRDRAVMYHPRMQIGLSLRHALAAATFVALATPVSAQLLNKDAPVVVGHFHMNATSVAEHRKFWVDTLGGTPEKIGTVEAVRFPGILLFFDQKKPSGPNRGTAFDHIGFAVPDVPAFTTRIVAAGYTLTVGREPEPGKEATAAQGTQAPYGRFSYILGPDGTKVELVTSAEKTPAPIVYHHIHFINKQYVEMRNWYVRAFNATDRTGPNTFTDFFAGGDLTGVGYSLNFFRWEGDQSVTHVGTKGRATDHVGFEVRNLPAFIKELEGKGIKLTEGYKKSNKAMGGVATAMIADPWGVQIELTEGLR